MFLLPGLGDSFVGLGGGGGRVLCGLSGHWGIIIFI